VGYKKKSLECRLAVSENESKREKKKKPFIPKRSQVKNPKNTLKRHVKKKDQALIEPIDLSK